MISVDQILVQFAMEKEAEPLLAALESLGSCIAKNQILEPGFSMRAFEFEFKRKKSSADVLKVAVTLAGKDLRHEVDAIGTIPASLQAFVGIKRYRPHLMINAGTCGGYESIGSKIGQVYIGKDQAAFHDRRVPIPKFEQAARGEFAIKDPKEFGIPMQNLERARISTGDSLDCPPVDQEGINRNGAILKEMEAAAIAYVASHAGVPLICFKGVTDFVDHPAPTAEQFFANYELTSHHVAAQVIEFIKQLSERAT